MQEKNKFSIIMPSYNDAKTITESINSVFNQTYPNWELIIINDGSTDDTKKVIDSVLTSNKNASKVKVITQQNQGQLNAIINSFRHLTGDYVYILHSDDVFFDNCVLEKANSLLQNSNLDGLITRKIPMFSDNQNIINGYINVLKYKPRNNRLAFLMLNNGSNLYMDMAFIKADILKRDYYYNYLYYLFDFHSYNWFLSYSFYYYFIYQYWY